MPAIKDLTGQVFGRLTVLDQAPHTRGDRGPRWRARCECGNTVTVYGANLRKGDTKSCGCLRREHAALRKIVDLTGHRFGDLLVTEQAEYAAGDRNAHWHAVCDCGREVVVRGCDLRAGKIRSCRTFKKAPSGAAAVKDRSRVIDTPQGRMTTLEAARVSGISYYTIYARIKNGVPAEHLFDPLHAVGRVRR